MAKFLFKVQSIQKKKEKKKNTKETETELQTDKFHSTIRSSIF